MEGQLEWLFAVKQLCDGLGLGGKDWNDIRKRFRDGDADIFCEQVVPSPVSLVSLVVVLTVPVRPPSVTCAVPVVCSLPPRSGGSGTSRSTRARSTFYGNRLLLPHAKVPFILTSACFI